MRTLKITLSSILAISLSVLSSCAEDATNEILLQNESSTTTQFLRIGSTKVSCTGEAEQTCYQIQHDTELGDQWEYFYDAIDGFDEQYEEGYVYEITVLVTRIENPPADASSLNYSLVEIISEIVVD